MLNKCTLLYSSITLDEKIEAHEKLSELWTLPSGRDDTQIHLEVKPHGTFCDYNIYLWSVFLLLVTIWMTVTKQACFSEEVYKPTTTLTRIKFKIWLGFFLWKICLWFPDFVGALQINSPKHVGLCFLVWDQCHPQSWKQNLTVKQCFSFKIDSGKGFVQQSQEKWEEILYELFPLNCLSRSVTHIWSFLVDLTLLLCTLHSWAKGYWVNYHKSYIIISK